jgi:hypothetical protein
LLKRVKNGYLKLADYFHKRGSTMAKGIPVYYTKKTSLEKNLQKFLEYVEDTAFLDETEDEKIGWQYIKKAEKGLNLNEVLKNVEDHGTDKLVALITIAEEEDLGPKEIFENIMASIYIEPASGFGGENYVFAVPVKRELEADLHKFPGKLDTVKYDDIYSELKKLLKPEVVNAVLENCSNDIENDKMYINIPQYYWAAFVDEEKFKDALVKKLDMTEDEIEQLAKIG